MTPEEWERAADEAAASLTRGIEALELLVSETAPRVPGFWQRVRQFGEDIRTAQAIKLEDKLALQHRLNAVCQHVRHLQRTEIARSEREREEISAGLDLIAEAVEDAQDPEELKESREELAQIRPRIEAIGWPARREERQQLWERWQAVNSVCWERLTALWIANEEALSRLLADAAAHLAAGRPRDAKSSIKEFHASLGAVETRRAVARDLRVQANRLWAEATELSSRKHQAYLVHLERRLLAWRAECNRILAEQARVEREIEHLEQRASAAPTDVAAALVRGQLHERRKALDRLTSDFAAVEREIQRGEDLVSAG